MPCASRLLGLGAWVSSAIPRTLGLSLTMTSLDASFATIRIAR